MCEESDGKIHSGCTAVTAFLRIEDEKGSQSFAPTPSSPAADSPESSQSLHVTVDGEGPADNTADDTASKSSSDSKDSSNKKKSNRFRRAIQSISDSILPSSSSSSQEQSRPEPIRSTSLVIPPSNTRRVLYSANAGDARGVLCRAGRAVRLTYDHKGSDKQEAKRITDAGGFVMSGRVNGVLAVTRSLGDSSMKEFVVGAPYTTETELCEEDEFVILACDGVSTLSLI